MQTHNLSNTRSTRIREDPTSPAGKKVMIEEQETAAKEYGTSDRKPRNEREEEPAHEVIEESPAEDMEANLKQIEEEIKKMGDALREVYYEMQTYGLDAQKRLNLEDKRHMLRCDLIKAHEDFKAMLKNKGDQEEQKLKTTRATEKKEAKEQSSRLSQARTRLAEAESELAASRARRLINLELLTDLELATFRLPYYYSYYSYYYPYTYSRYYYPYSLYRTLDYLDLYDSYSPLRYYRYYDPLYYL